MSWVELRLIIPRHAAEELGAVLMDAGAVGCQEDYLPGEKPPTRQPWDTGPLAPEPDRLVLKAWWAAGDRSKAETQVDALLVETEDVERVSWVQVDDESWGESWRTAAVRIDVCEGLVVAPPWLAQPGDLIIEPGMAFGTGDHPTTLSCLRAVMRQGVAGERCLDVGTGSGILAIAAARIGMVARGIDIDPESARAAADNARLNGTEIQADLTPLAAIDGRFGLVVANLFAEVIVALSTELKRVASRHLAVAGVLADRADLVVEALAPMRLVRRDIEGDWCHMGFEW